MTPELLRFSAAALLVWPAFAQPKPAQFSAPRQFATSIPQPAGPFAPATGDFNRDGYKDFAVASGTDVYVVLGSAAGPQDGASYTLTADGFVSCVTAADLNGDGILDLVATASNPDSAAFLLFGRGDGTFDAPISLTLPETPSYVAVGDFNGDGVPDLAFTALSHTVYIALGLGKGTFAPASSFSLGFNGVAQTVLAADLRDTGKDDLIVQSEISSTTKCPSYAPCFPNDVYLNDGRGGFTFGSNVFTSLGTNPATIVIADLNGAGYPDLAVDRLQLSAVTIFLGNGAGQFTKGVNYETEDEPWTLAVADVNGDGILDIVTGNTISSITVLPGNGDGSFGNGASYSSNVTPLWVDVGGYYGKDPRDILVFNAQDSAEPTTTGLSLIRTESGKPVAEPTFTLPTLGTGALADMNGDGKLDLVGISGHEINVVLGLGNGVFGKVQATVPIPGFPPQSTVVADINGDGRLDVAACNGSNPATLVVALQNASGGYEQVQSAEPACQVVWAGDLNLDGIPDLILNTGYPNLQGDLIALLGRGNGMFQAPITITPAPQTFTVADFNGDGIPDIAYCNPVAGQPPCPQIQYGNGDGTFQPPISLDVTNQGYLMTSGDFNNDGRPDLALLSQEPGSLLILLNNGNGTFSESLNIAAFAPSELITGDFNGDGNLDLAIWGASAGIQFYLGDGKGKVELQPGIVPCVSLEGCLMLPGDLNGDGKLDITTLDYQDIAGPGAISTLINSTR